MPSLSLSLPQKHSTTSRPSKNRPATFYVARAAADIRWRVELPCRHLKAKLTCLSPKEWNRDLFTPSEDGKFPWALSEQGSIYPAHEGVAVWIRPDMNRAVHAVSMAANGIRTVAELDDNHLSPPVQNLIMRDKLKYTKEDRRLHLQTLATFDAIVFATEWLRDSYHWILRKELHIQKKNMPELHVAHNHVDPDDWPKRTPAAPPGDGRLRVGWMGSYQHLWDLRLAAPALRLASDSDCEVVFVGMDPADWDPDWRKLIPEYTVVPWSSHYHKRYLNFDIGLIPLVQNQHTDGKSDVKFLEYAMSGVATVAQSSPIYNKTIIHGETGLLAASPDDMASKMLELILYPLKRKRMVEAAKQWVLENRTMQRQGVQEWRSALG